MARSDNPKHSGRTYDPDGAILRALRAPVEERQKPPNITPEAPVAKPPPMGGLKPLPRFAKTRKSEAWQRRANDDGEA